MKIAVPRERAAGETRAALVPEGVSRLTRGGHDVLVEAGSGEAAGFPDAAYGEAGASLLPAAPDVWAGADVVVKVQPPSPEEAARLGSGRALVCFLHPAQNRDLLRDLAARGVTGFAVDALPRITRAQPMDALSAMSTVAGYKAALLAAGHLGKFFPMLMTAAGTIPPARVLVIGAGVAGLQAIATTRRLGAQVEAFDTRPAAKEEVKSLGAAFVDVDLGEGGQDRAGYAVELSEAAKQRQREALRDRVARADAVITTALVPGRPAPRIVTAEMVRGMPKGSVIVDLAAPAGGNCELTRPGETAVAHGVTILGPLNLPALLPNPASRMLSRNFVALVEHLFAKGAPDLSDEITRACCVIHAGEARAP
ncbi:MAG: Re/Si-specific NAD(P)(+) transhydrogenase subunit alpha [Planctomycetota bacterium]